MVFNKKYFIGFVVLFLVEVYIALYVRDAIIRPYFGDLLVVILVYCFVKSFFNFRILSTAIGVFVFACLIELLQYLNFVERIGLANSKIAKTVLGSSFEWSDILAYFLGILIILFVELKINNKPL